MEYIILFVLAYLIGNISPAIIIGKKTRNIDIRHINSKNAGTSNVTMSIGWRWGMLVLFLDIMKGLLPVLIVRLFYPEQDALWFITGLGAIVGHIYPVFYGFKGGKGSATFGGVLFATVPVYGFIMLAVYVLILFTTDYIALSTLFVSLVTPIFLYVMEMHVYSIVAMTIFAGISFIKHRENYYRILKGEEVGIRKFTKNKDKIRVNKNET